jgi:hypothetical protein
MYETLLEHSFPRDRVRVRGKLIHGAPTTYETERTSFEETDQRARRPLSGRQLLDMFAARAPANVDRSHSKCMQLSKPAEMEHLSAHAVIDASGTWSGPNPLGGGAPNLYYTVPVPPLDPGRGVTPP